MVEGELYGDGCAERMADHVHRFADAIQERKQPRDLLGETQISMPGPGRILAIAEEVGREDMVGLTERRLERQPLPR